jgi:hypothetical protein
MSKDKRGYWERVNAGIKAGLSADEIAAAFADRLGEKYAEQLRQGVPAAEVINQMAQPFEQMAGVGRKTKQEVEQESFKKAERMPVKVPVIGDLGIAGQGLVNIGSGFMRPVVGAQDIAGTMSEEQVAAQRGAMDYLSERPGGTLGQIVGEGLALGVVPASAAARTVGLGLRGLGAKAAGEAVGRSAIAQAATTGGLIGALQPTVEGESRALNVAGGAAIGGAIPVAIGAAQGAGQLAKAYTEEGRQQLAAQALRRLSTDPDAVRAGLQSVDELVPGSVPTTATAVRDPGLLGAERSLRERMDTMPAFAAADQAAAEARQQALSNIARTPRELAVAKAARAEEGKMMYEPLMGVTVTPDAQLVDLLKRPSMKKAVNRASSLAEEEGVSLTEGDLLSGRGMHYLKMAMDDIATDPNVQAKEGISKTQSQAIKKTRDALVGWLDEAVPEYKAARTAYAQASGPIREMEAAQAIESGIEAKAARTVKGTPSPTARQMETQVRAASESKMYGPNFSPESQQVLDNIVRDIQRSEAVGAKGVKSAGSPTFGLFVADSIIEAARVGDNKAADVIRNLPGLKAKDPEIMQLMAEALVNPEVARRLLDKLPDQKSRTAIMRTLENARSVIGRSAGRQVSETAGTGVQAAAKTGAVVGSGSLADLQSRAP